MEKKENIRITNWGINIELIAKAKMIYLKGLSLEETKDFFIKEGYFTEDVKYEAITILKLAQSCNASLQEIRTMPVKGTIRFSFEFEFREEFLKFENSIKNLSI